MKKKIWTRQYKKQSRGYFLLMVILFWSGLIDIATFSPEVLANEEILNDQKESEDLKQIIDENLVDDGIESEPTVRNSLTSSGNSLFANSRFDDFTGWNYVVYTTKTYYLKRNSDKLGSKKANGFQHVLSPIFGNNEAELKALGNNSFFVYLSPTSKAALVDNIKTGLNFYTQVNNLIQGHQYKVSLSVKTVGGIGDSKALYSIKAHDQTGNVLNIGDKSWVTLDTTLQNRELKWTATKNSMRFSLGFNVIAGVTQVQISDLSFIDITPAGIPVIGPIMDSSQRIIGTGQVGDRIIIKNSKGDELGQTTVDSEGKWNVAVAKGSLKSNEILIATAIQPDSNQSTKSTPETISHDPLLDITPSPIVKVIHEDSEPNKAVVSGNIPEVSSGITVTVTDEQGQKIGTTITDENGIFSLVVDRDMKDKLVSLVAIKEGKKPSKPVSIIISQADPKSAVLELEVPTLSFGIQKISSKNETYFGDPSGSLSVKDFRVKSRQTPWKLTAKYTSKESHLPGHLIYKDSEAEQEITNEDQLIYHMVSKEIERDKRLSSLWNAENQRGFFLKVDTGMALKGSYESSITWSLQDTPTPK